MGKTQILGSLVNTILTDSSNNVGIGGAANASFKLQVTGTTNVTGVLTLGSTISNGTNTYTLPSATGTLALTSNLSTYVPYTGATGDVDLGFSNFDANQINGFKIVAKLDGTSSGSLILRTGTSGYSYGNDSISLISSPTSANTLTIISDVSSVTKIAQIGLGSLTATRTFTLPNASGTIALLSGAQTFTGATTFSSSVTTTSLIVAASTAPFIRIDDIGFGSENGITWQPTGFTSRGSLTLNYLTAEMRLSAGVSAATYFQTFYTNGAERMRITSGGNVVIGGTTVQNLFATRGNLTINGVESILNLSTSDTNAGYLFHNATNMFLVNAKNGATIFSTNDTERMRITSGGAVGIGISSPTRRLHVYGSTSIFEGILVENSLSNAYALYQSKTGNSDLWQFGTWNNNSFRIGTSGIADFLTITNLGRVLIGTTTDYGYKETIVDSLNGLFVRVESESSGATPFLVQNNNSGGTNIFEIKGHGFTKLSVFTYNNTTSNAANLFINTDGGLYRSTASTSRVKDNITDWNGNGLDTILALKPRTFNYKADYYSHPEVEMLGLIAEEVAEVSPYLAEYENQDRTGQVENVKYATIVVPLIKAVQEQQKQIEELKALINNK